MPPDRLSGLSPRERDCLRLVRRNFSSKEIAKELGISHHTVDDHLKHAMAVLGVGSRFEASRALAEQEATPQPLGTQPQAVDPGPPPPPELPPDRSGFGRWWQRRPFLRNGGRTNELTTSQRLAWIVAGAVALLFGLSQFANVLTIVQSIARGRGT